VSDPVVRLRFILVQIFFEELIERVSN